MPRRTVPRRRPRSAGISASASSESGQHGLGVAKEDPPRLGELHAVPGTAHQDGAQPSFSPVRPFRSRSSAGRWSGSVWLAVIPAVIGAAPQLVDAPPATTAIAAVTTIGYLGSFTCPPLIGLLAELSGLTLALRSTIVVASLLTAALARLGLTARGHRVGRERRGTAGRMRTDRTIELLRQGYPWAGRLRAGAAAVPIRLLGRRAAVVGGPAGVRRIYDPRLTRRRAFPMPIQLVLFGPGTSAHSLDDAEHHHRKAMFLEVLTPDAVAALGRRAEQEWETAVRRWAGRDRVELFDEAVHVLAASVLPWARRAGDAGGASAPGPPARRGARRLRHPRTGVRAGRRRPAAGGALGRAAGAPGPYR